MEAKTTKTAEVKATAPKKETVKKVATATSKPKTTATKEVKAKAAPAAKSAQPKVAKPRAPKAIVADDAARNLRKTRVGTVVSNKMDKTIVVAIVNNVRHPIYKKIVKSTKKFKAHDEENVCNIGDVVEIAETRHLSKDKYFRLVKIIERAK